MLLFLIFIFFLILVCDLVMGDNGEMVRKELCIICGVVLNLEKFLMIKNIIYCNRIFSDSWLDGNVGYVLSGINIRL